MARPLGIHYRHAYYHVTCWCNDRRSIYRDDRDRELFLEKLRTFLGIYQVILHAYVLMEKSLLPVWAKQWAQGHRMMSERWRLISYKDKDLTPTV